MDRGLRAKWLPKLAAVLGWKPQRLRHLLNHNGLGVPYDELQTLRVLKGYGISFAKYKPMASAVGVEVLAASVKPVRGLTVANAQKQAKGINGAAAEDEEEDDAEEARDKHGSWADKLIVTRLAKLLPEGPTAKGKTRIRHMLKKHGLTDFKNVDEASALAVMEAEGIPIDGFEYEAQPGTPGGLMVPPPADTYELLREQYIELGERLKKAVEEGKNEAKAHSDTRRVLLTVKRILASFEAQILPIAISKFGGISTEPLNFPIDALALIKKEFQE